MKKELYTFLLLCISMSTSTFSFAQPAGYKYVREITINESQIPDGSYLNNFPFLFKVTDLDLRSLANGGHLENSNGYDILFYLHSCDTPLDYQLDHYNPVTGDLSIWVRIPVLSTTADTHLYFYYGNPAITVDGSTPSTWDPGYSAVWHLGNNPATGGGIIRDATSNAHHGTAHGAMPASSLITGKIGNALLFDEINDYVRVPDFLYGQELTVSFWFNTSEVNGNSYQYLFSHGGWSLPNSLNVYIGEDNITIPAEVPNRSMMKTVFRDDNDANNTDTLNAGNSYINGNWHYYTIRIQDWGGAYIYMDGSVVAIYSVWGANVFNPITDVFLGGREDLNAGRFYGGLLDEVRISSVWRSSDWIRTEYNNQNNPSTFFALGPETSGVNFCFPLKLQLSGLTARVAGQTVRLQWVQVPQLAPENFVIERSPNTTDWQAIGSTAGYVFYDSFPPRGLSYYRVRYSINDIVYTSEIARVHHAFTNQGIRIYPNPSHDGVLYADFPGTEMPEQVTLVDAAGKFVSTLQVEKKGSTTYILKPDRFTHKGFYILRFRFRKRIENYSLILL